MPRWARWALSGVGVLLVLWALSVIRWRHAEQQAIAAAMPRFAARVAQTPRVAGQPRLLDWPWKETGAAIGAQVFETVVYDESDEIGRSASSLSVAWRAHADDRLQGIANGLAHHDRDDLIEVKSIGDHFYLVTETLQ
jgi:hypothetical protein